MRDAELRPIQASSLIWIHGKHDGVCSLRESPSDMLLGQLFVRFEMGQSNVQPISSTVFDPETGLCLYGWRRRQTQSPIANSLSMRCLLAFYFILACAFLRFSFSKPRVFSCHEAHHPLLEHEFYLEHMK